MPMDGGRAGRGLRQPAPLQRDLPRHVPPAAQRAAARVLRAAADGGAGGHAAAPLPAALRLAGDARLPRGARDRRRRGGRGRRLPAHGRARGPPRHASRSRHEPRAQQPGGDRALPARARPPGVLARVRRVFDVGADIETIGAHLSRDPSWPAGRARPGLRAPGAWDGFELAVRAILGQQVTVAAARRLAGGWSRCAASRSTEGAPAGARRARSPRPRGWRRRTRRRSACRGARGRR